MEDQDLRGLHEAFAEFKTVNDQMLAEVKAYGSASGELKARVEKLHEAMDAQEAKINARIEAAEKKAAEAARLEEKLDELTALVARKGGTLLGSLDELKEKAQEHRRIFIKALRSATDHRAIKSAGILTPDEVKVLLAGNDVTGGYLAPTDYVREILASVVEYSNIRSIARLRTTSAGSVSMPKKIQSAVATWTAEKTARSETQNPNWGMEEVKVHEMHALAKVSTVDLEDSIFDLEGFLRDEFAEQMGVAEGAAFIHGNGVAKPEGLLTNADVQSTNSGHASLLTGDGMIALYYDLKEAYLQNAYWVMSRSTLKAVRQLKETANGQYLWAPGIRTDGRPATILDRPYVTAPDMPPVAAGLKPILFGDFRRAYLIVDRVAMEVMVDPYTSKGTGMVEFSARRRVGGQVVLPEAVRKMNISA